MPPTSAARPGARAVVAHALVLALYGVVAALYVRPLFSHLTTHLAVDAGDPALNAAVLWWNASVVPFTPAWWHQPWFHPAEGVTTFTENLTGLSVLATPIAWVTGSPVATYNLTFFASWPLSAFAMYLLVRRLTGQWDAALVAGFAYAFTPYRASAALGHLQTLSAYWLPIALLALHAYFQDQRRRWLILFGAAWLLQGLANGYYLFFGGVLIGFWLVYFGSSRTTWRPALTATAAWLVASAPLAPILLHYRRFHEQYGLRRSAAEAEAFSAHLDSFGQVSDRLAVWSQHLPSGQEMLFPGLTAIALILAAVVVALTRPRNSTSSPWDRALLIAATSAVVASVAAIGWYLTHGRWTLRAVGAELFTMSDANRALVVLALGVGVLIWKSRLLAAIAARGPFVFYAASTVVMALLACGPVLRAGGNVVLDPAPYRLLMNLPGFGELRVPSRFWMMGVLSLSVAAGLAFAALVPARARAVRLVLCVIASLGLLVDGWLKTMPVAAAPPVWASTEGADSRLPLLELPLGPRWDNAATLRATAHGRRVFNGVSGYDPPHYAALEAGLRARDPGMLAALSSIGAYEVAIELAHDPDGAWQTYVGGATGVREVARDANRVIFRIPATAANAPEVGPAVPVSSLSASDGDPSVLLDDRAETHWAGGPQRDGQWLLADLGAVQPVGGVSLAIRDQTLHFPRALTIELSVDGAAFATAWSGTTAPTAFPAIVERPRDAWIRIAFQPATARYVRLRQTAVERIAWVVPDLEINAPARSR